MPKLPLERITSSEHNDSLQNSAVGPGEQMNGQDTRCGHTPVRSCFSGQQMASRKTLLAAAAMVLVATASLLVPATASRKKKTFTVGDDSGWDLDVDYDAWASGKNFKVGDTLVFRPNKEWQDVVQVNLDSFKACGTSNDARVMSSGGNAVNVVLAQSGDFFFISYVGCGHGMKLHINVQ